jgi:hypothetical protein
VDFREDPVCEENRQLRAENARLRVEAAAHTVEFSGVLEDNARLRADNAWLRLDLLAAADRIAAQRDILKRYEARMEAAGLHGPGKAPQAAQDEREGGGEGDGP